MLVCDKIICKIIIFFSWMWSFSGLILSLFIWRMVLMSIFPLSNPKNGDLATGVPLFGGTKEHLSTFPARLIFDPAWLLHAERGETHWGLAQGAYAVSCSIVMLMWSDAGDLQSRIIL